MNTQPNADVSVAAADFALDNRTKGLGDAVRDYVARIRGGDLGVIPSVLSMIVLIIPFWLSTDVFMTTTNLANLLEQAAPIAVVAMAVSFVLLLGEIDLSAGFTAGVAAALMTTRLREGWPLWQAILIAAAVALFLGLIIGVMVSYLGIPSFVVTLSTLLIFQGILLLLVKEGGTVRLENQRIKDLVGSNLSVAWSWGLAIATVIVIAGFALLKQSRSHGTISLGATLVKIAVVSVIILVPTSFLVQDRTPPRGVKTLEGIPVAVPAVGLILVVLTFILTRTKFGRHMYAVGGNAEAARRAGIPVARIRLAAFAICALLAAVGGAFIASKVDSVSPNTGGGETLLLAVGAAVIGGTSLFGGKGRMLNAVLGSIVLALIPNGLPLMGKRTYLGAEIDFSSSGIKFVVSGVFLLVAASIDAISRKRRV